LIIEGSLMRFARRILLLAVVGCAIAGGWATSAKALGFEDEPCPPMPQLKVCHPDAEVGKAYSLNIEGKGGCTPDSLVYELVGGSSLPPGLSLNSGNADVTGVPTKAGEYRFWLQARDIPAWQGGAFWCTDDKASQWEFQITVVPGLQIQQRQSVLAPAQLTTPYSLQLTATGGSGLTWSVSSGALPAGLNLNKDTGLISGTPTQTGDARFQIKVADSRGRSDVQTYTLSIVEPLKVTKPALVAEVGMPFSLTLAATGGRAPYTWLATGLPAGLTLDTATGAISGTPTTPGTASLKVTVKDALGLVNTLDVSLPVAAKLALLKRALPAATVGRAYRARLFAAGGVAPRAWSATLPAGLRINSRTGIISGTPRRAGNARITVEVTDKLGAVSTATFRLKIAGGARR
jgi:large repetitive protein